MCTAVNYKTKCHYFGRNLDLERGYGECVVITPRNFPLAFRFTAPTGRKSGWNLMGKNYICNQSALKRCFFAFPAA